MPDLTTTTLPSVSSATTAAVNNESSQLVPNAATCVAPSNPVPRKGTSDSGAVEPTAMSVSSPTATTPPPVDNNESSQLAPTAASFAAPSRTGVVSRNETSDSAAAAETAPETVTIPPSISSAAAAPKNEANGPWWKNEPVPSFQEIWPILEKIGFSKTSDGKFLLPKNTPGLQKLQSVPTFQSYDGLRKFLCAFGIPCFQETSTRLIRDEPEQLHRWITFANVPVHSGNSIERLAGITAPQNDAELLTLLSRFRFEQVDGNLYVPDYKKIRKAGEAWGQTIAIPHVHFFDVKKELETDLRVFVRGAWRFGLLIDSEDDHEGPDKFLRMDSKKQERHLRLRLWAAESKAPLPTFTEKSLEIADKTGTLIVSAEARLKPFEMMPQTQEDTDQPNEKNGGGAVESSTTATPLPVDNNESVQLEPTAASSAAPNYTGVVSRNETSDSAAAAAAAEIATETKTMRPSISSTALPPAAAPNKESSQLGPTGSSSVKPMNSPEVLSQKETTDIAATTLPSVSSASAVDKEPSHQAAPPSQSLVRGEAPPVAVAPSNPSKVSASSSSSPLKNQSEAITKVLCSMVQKGDVDDAVVLHGAANISVPVDTMLRVALGQDVGVRAEEQQQSISSASAAANNETSQQQLAPLPPLPPPQQLPSQSVVPQPASDVASWCCDVCQVRSFPTYQEACDHEDECRTQQQQQLLLSRQKDVAQQPQSKAAALADDGGSNVLAESEARGGQPQQQESISSVTATSESPSSKPSYSGDTAVATNEPFDSFLVATGTSATDALSVSSSTDAETEEAAGTSSDATATKNPPVASFASDTLKEPLAETCTIAAATNALSVSTFTDAKTKDPSGTSSTVTTANDSPVASSAVKNTTAKKPLVETCRFIAATLASWVSSSTDAAMKELSPTSSSASVTTKESSSASSAGDTTKKHSSITSSSVDRTREPLEDSCTAAAATTNDATLATSGKSSASMSSLSSSFPGGEENALSGASGARSCTVAAATMKDATLATNGAPPASMGSLPSSQEGESPSFGPSSMHARMLKSSCNVKVPSSSTVEAPSGTSTAGAKRKGAAEAGGMMQSRVGTSSQFNKSEMLETDGSCFPRSRRTDRREPFILDDSPDETKALSQDRATVRRKRAAMKTAGLKGRRKEPPVSAPTKEEKEPVARLVSYDGSSPSSGSSNEHASAASNSEKAVAKTNRGLSACSAVSDTKDSPPGNPAKKARVVLTIEDDSDDDETIASDSKPPARPIDARTEVEESDESEMEVWCLGSRSASEPTTSADCGTQKTAAPAAETASSSDSSVCDDGASSATASSQEEG